MYQFSKVKKTNLQINFVARKSKRKCQFSLCIKVNESSILNFVLRSFVFFFYNFRDYDLFNAITAEFITLDTHYKYDRFNDMVELLNVINKKETVSYLQDDTTSIIVVGSTTHTTKETIYICLESPS
jgi:hypothetical protein